MEPISSSTSSRASASQTPVPVQQKRDNEALNAPQSRPDTYSISAPGQDVQLQRRQVVEDISHNQKVTDQLGAASDSLRTAKSLAEQATNPALGADERQSLSQQFADSRKQLDQLASQVDRSGGDGSRLRVSTGISSAEEAQTTRDALDSSLDQVGSDLATLSLQGQALDQDFPRTARNSSGEPSVRSSQDAARLSSQLQQQLRARPDTALASQATISQQTTRLLFQ